MSDWREAGEPSASLQDEMRAAAMDPAEEPPSLLWGLDSVFSAFARLYIRDILEMTESTQVPGNTTRVMSHFMPGLYCRSSQLIFGAIKRQFDTFEVLNPAC